MAEVVGKFPDALRLARGARDMYPYDLWFNGKVWKIDVDKDVSKVKRPMMAFYAAARKRGLKVSIRMSLDKKFMYLQATKKKEKGNG